MTAFQLKILDNVSSIGSGAGIAASSRRGSSSKGTKVSNLKLVQIIYIFFFTIPGIFGSSHVCMLFLNKLLYQKIKWFLDKLYLSEKTGIHGCGKVYLMMCVII